jgi:Rrf2 family protein
LISSITITVFVNVRESLELFSAARHTVGMDLRFSRRADYAVRAALEIARHDGQVKRADVAAAIDAPPSVVAQALADLARAGVVRATAGRLGGYVLARPAEAITVWEVVSAVDPPPAETRCVLHDRVCASGGVICPFHATLDAARASWVAALDRDSLADVAARSGARAA